MPLMQAVGKPRHNQTEMYYFTVLSRKSGSPRLTHHHTPAYHALTSSRSCAASCHHIICDRMGSHVAQNVNWLGLALHSTRIV